jgi:hypothetical protein
MNMKKMTQRGRGYSRHHNKRKQMPHPKTGWIHAGEQSPFPTSRQADFDEARTLGPRLPTILARCESARKRPRCPRCFCFGP